MTTAAERWRLAKQFFWTRHANPGSVWTLVGAYPVLVAAVYRRDRRLLAGTLLFVAANPLLFSEPDDDAAWATRVVLGERVWLDRGLLSSPGDALFVALMAPVFLSTLRAAAERRSLRTAVGTAVSLVVMFLFFDRMARLYETRG
ncbi:hypothetical protein C474_17419 [Halogeometricum pallidum JCM 14848]|uniref:Uncharacterized protein n=1 Tax=Halogeometricum pallidum JCM 14848 TaxID=1227487 RepID=M0CVA1_HALPD|nr:DUF6653 family protein [Halogeometricum pallidum]ELZ27150.1 hypothetical protein C474_17419 [Halogeometricum pallidum JCM 14848]